MFRCLGGEAQTFCTLFLDSMDLTKISKGDLGNSFL